MSEEIKYSSAEVMASQDVPESEKNKISLHEMMMKLGIIDENTNLDDAVYARVDEVMQEHGIDPEVRAYAEGLVALEYLFTTDPDSKEEVAEIAADLAEYAFSDVTPQLSDEELEVFKTALNIELASGENFIEAFHSVVQRRKDFMKSLPERDIYVDREGFVQPRPNQEGLN